MAALHAIAAELNRTAGAAEAERLGSQLLAGGWLLGLLGRTPDEHFHGQPTPSQGEQGAAAPLTNANIEALIERRNQARRERDFQQADAIRDQLAAAGVELEDSRAGTRWRRG